MADDSLKDSNPSGHIAEVPPDVNCLVCYDEISSDNFLEYQTVLGGEWHPSAFCSDCAEYLKSTQFEKFRRDFDKSTCAREQKALFTRGPPVNVFDRHGFPEAGNNEIAALWSFHDKRAVSCRLHGSLTGERRLQYWKEMERFMIDGEKEEDDDDNKNDEKEEDDDSKKDEQS